MQLWGIVQNLSGEDWNNTRLTLVADAPLALTTQLEQPVIPGRPVLTDDGGAIAVLPQAETTLAESAPPPPPPEAEPSEMEEMSSLRAEDKKSSPARSRKNMKAEHQPARGARVAPVLPAAKPSAPSRTRNLAALAAVAVSGGATRYELPNPVTVPNNNATMLLLVDKEVPGEATYLFAPDSGVPDSASHPFRVARS